MTIFPYLSGLIILSPRIGELDATETTVVSDDEISGLAEEKCADLKTSSRKLKVEDKAVEKCANFHMTMNLPNYFDTGSFFPFSDKSGSAAQ